MNTFVETPSDSVPAPLLASDTLGGRLQFIEATGRVPDASVRPETPTPRTAPPAVEPAEDIAVAAAVAMFPAAPMANRKTYRPSSPVPAITALEALVATLTTPVPDQAADAAAATQAAVDIAKALSPDQAISQRELERRSVAHVADARQRAARAHLEDVLPRLEQALGEARPALEAAHAARRVPQDAGIGLTPDEQAILGQPSAFADERQLYGASIVELRGLRRSIDNLFVAMTVTATMAVDELLALAASGTPAERRRADYHLDRVQMRQDTDVATAMREHLAVKARHTEIRDARVPASVRAAEQRESAYVDALVSHARFRCSAVRILLQERSSLVGLFVGDDIAAIDVRRLRDEAVQAWAPVVARARQAREAK